MKTCQFCNMLHNPELSNCNDPHTRALIRRRGPIARLKEPASDNGESVRQKALIRLSRLICQAVDQRTDDINVRMQERVMAVLEAECVLRSSVLCGNEVLVRIK